MGWHSFPGRSPGTGITAGVRNVGALEVGIYPDGCRFLVADDHAHSAVMPSGSQSLANRSAVINHTPSSLPRKSREGRNVNAGYALTDLFSHPKERNRDKGDE